MKKIKTKNTEPDFDKMWEQILERINFPFVYLIEEEQTNYWLAEVPGNKAYLTKDPNRATQFKGKDGKALANLYLALNQSSGTLKNFIVTEHLFL